MLCYWLVGWLVHTQLLYVYMVLKHEQIILCRCHRLDVILLVYNVLIKSLIRWLFRCCRCCLDLSLFMFIRLHSFCWCCCSCHCCCGHISVCIRVHLSHCNAEWVELQIPRNLCRFVYIKYAHMLSERETSHIIISMASCPLSFTHRSLSVSYGGFCYGKYALSVSILQNSNIDGFFLFQTDFCRLNKLNWNIRK